MTKINENIRVILYVDPRMGPDITIKPDLRKIFQEWRDGTDPCLILHGFSRVEFYDVTDAGLPTLLNPQGSGVEKP
jgi:hypothetical protein